AERSHMSVRALALIFLSLSGCSGCYGRVSQDSWRRKAAIENTTHDCLSPEISPIAQLANVSELPDPYTFTDGPPVRHKADWRCRRAEIAHQLQAYELGTKPSAIQPTQTQVTAELVRLTLAYQGQQIEFEAKMHLPAKGEPPYPAVIALGRSFLNNE